MKKLSVFLPAILLGLAATAQKPEVRESNEKIGDGSSHPCLVSTIYQASADDVESKWKSKMKDLNPEKVSTKDGVFADNAKLKSNGNNTVDIYARIEKGKENELKLIVGVNLGGAWMTSSNGSQYQEIKKMMMDVSTDLTKEALAAVTKMEQKKLDKLSDDQKDLEKDQNSLTKDIEDYKQKIEDYKAKIKKAEDDIVKNKSDQEKKKGEIDAQKKVVETAQSKEKDVN